MTTPPVGEGYLSLGKRLERIETKLDDVVEKMPTVNDLDRRVAELESWQTWAMRIVIGAVITALVGVVIVVQ
ncbi:hypothetical protein ACFSYH_05845 [Populibacterium corticicola]|uniref:DUF1640 domain-containing protein n=1 Tax=Populibacterium corticicola TaxID=1812826 RepID=A0ABW5XDN0_9MICO